jgi:hypothetical protein
VTRLPDPYAMRAAGAGASADRMSQSRRLDPDRRGRWRRGAAGERTTAALLEPLALAGWVVLHDRRVPGMAANIDHLVAGSTMVWVLDSKVWRGDIVRLGDGELWYADAPVRERVMVVARIAEAARVALARRPELASLDVAVACVLQGVKALGNFLPSVEGVVLLTPHLLVPHIAENSAPTARAGELGIRLNAVFPPRG